MESFHRPGRYRAALLGSNILRSAAAAASYPAGAAPGAVDSSSPAFELHVKKDDISAVARKIDGESTVLEGSGARPSWTDVEHAYKILREKLVREGAIVPALDGTAMRFARNQVFASPSAAALSRYATACRLPGSVWSRGAWPGHQNSVCPTNPVRRAAPGEGAYLVNPACRISRRAVLAGWAGTTSGMAGWRPVAG